MAERLLPTVIIRCGTGLGHGTIPSSMVQGNKLMERGTPHGKVYYIMHSLQAWRYITLTLIAPACLEVRYPVEGYNLVLKVHCGADASVAHLRFDFHAVENMQNVL